MSTTDKQILKVVSLQAGSIELGELEHPNKMPFSGLLTYFDVPSDKPVGGAGGKRVIIPAEYGIPALASLQGMAVDFDPLLMDKHVPKHKIGMIENASVGDRQANGGLPVFISGHIFAYDFPDEALDIKQYQADLGFSYETIDTPVMDTLYEGETVLRVCDELVFGGAAILLAEKAAFTTTSLAAQSQDQEQEVTNLELDQIIAAVMSSMEAKYDLQAKGLQETMTNPDGASSSTNLTASEETVAGEQTDVNVEGVGEGDQTTEQQVVQVEAATDLTAKAQGEVKDASQNVQIVDFQAMAVDLQARLDAMKTDLEQAKADLKAEADAKEQNSHKGFAYPMNLAAKYNLKAEADSYEAQIAEVDAMNGLSTEERMALKFELRQKHLKK